MLWPFVLLTIIALAMVLYTEYRESATTTNGAGPQGQPRFDRRLALVGASAKTVASLGFVAAAVSLGAFDTFFGQTLFLALMWSLLGDILLVFKGSRIAFMFGIAAFLMAHLGYVMLFRLRGVDTTAFLLALVGFAGVAFFIWRGLAPHVRGGMRIAVGAYIAVITLMVACAVGTTVAQPALLPLLAAVLFWLSDLTVARQRFVRRSFWNRAIGLPLYFAAQYLFVALLP